MGITNLKYYMRTQLAVSLFALTIALCSSAHADYMMKIPLEISNGGSLPNQSIKLVDSTTPPVEEEISEECIITESIVKTALEDPKMEGWSFHSIDYENCWVELYEALYDYCDEDQVNISIDRSLYFDAKIKKYGVKMLSSYPNQASTRECL